MANTAQSEREKAVRVADGNQNPLIINSALLKSTFITTNLQKNPTWINNVKLQTIKAVMQSIITIYSRWMWLNISNSQKHQWVRIKLYWDVKKQQTNPKQNMNVWAYIHITALSQLASWIQCTKAICCFRSLYAPFYVSLNGES